MKAIVQSEAAECGLASLAMVADAHGLSIGLAEMRRRFPLSLKGAKLGQMIQIAQQLGLSARPLRLELVDMGKLKLPCILHWDMNHFVVLKQVGAGQVTVLDPALGERRLAWAQLSDHFTGVALELEPAEDFVPRPPPPAITLRQLTGPVRGLGAALSQVLLLSLALQFFVLLAPFLMQWVVDQVLVSADRDLLTVLGLGFGLALLLQVGIGVVRGMTVVYLSSQLGLQWTGNVFAHLLRLPLDFFEKRNLGDISSRLGSVRTIQQTLTTRFVEALVDGLLGVLTMALMLMYSWKLALLTVGVVVLYAGVRLLAWRPLREGSERQLEAEARQQTHLLETLRGMQSVKVAGQESQRRSGYDNLRVEAVNQEVRLAHLALGFSGAGQLLFGIERIAVICIAAGLTLDGVFSVGMLIAYLAYKDQFALRMNSLIDKGFEFGMLRLHGERLADIALAPPEQEPVDAAVVPECSRIEVERLSFRYGEGEPWVVEECSFTIAAGESVAIIGASGCGKTTLLKLMLGLLQPTSGTIRIGGHDLQAVGPRNARSLIGAVMQDDQLFAGSIADNISFFDADVDPARVEMAAGLAAVHEEIMAMPMGYHGLIGDMGSALSGGQKQRILLARALYRQPRLLYLDEATSHLDVARERLVNAAVQQLRLTRLIVAHRPETIASADRVLVMERGRMVPACLDPVGSRSPGSSVGPVAT